MKVAKRAEKSISKPEKNSSNKNFAVIVVALITAVLIFWVYTMGMKAEQTVSVVMWAEPIYKNEVITESMVKEYKMLKGEYEKYAITTDDGTKSRRIPLWDERYQIINKFAAYPLQQDTVVMAQDIISSRVDNSDTIMYSYPGKDIVKLDVGSSDLDSFKTFLQPGDRVNITAIYTDEETVNSTDQYGNQQSQQVETIKEETPFQDIVVADLINGSGQSILDIYQSYNDATSYEQAEMDASDTFKESVTPSAILVALTPEEKSQYYKYVSKQNIKFQMSLPQRTQQNVTTSTTGVDTTTDSSDNQ